MSDQIRASRRKYHIIYKTTCNVTGRWYIGMHSTNDLQDGYLGSGQVLWKSIKKYGKDQHTCIILEYHENRKALADREEEILTTELLKDQLCMNLRSGGTGNYPGIPTSNETRQRKSIAMKAFYSTPEGKALARNRVLGCVRSPETRAKMSKANLGRIVSEEAKAKMSVSAKSRPRSKATEQAKQRMKDSWKLRTVKPLTAEHRENIRSSMLGRESPMKGRQWITNGSESKTIMKTETIPSGWRNGRS